MARSPISSASGQPNNIDFRIKLGSSLLGLSSVTNTTSAYFLAAFPINSLLTLSRSPPAPMIINNRPITCGRIALSAVLTASGVWA